MWDHQDVGQWMRCIEWVWLQEIPPHIIVLNTCHHGWAPVYIHTCHRNMNILNYAGFFQICIYIYIDYHRIHIYVNLCISNILTYSLRVPEYFIFLKKNSFFWSISEAYLWIKTTIPPWISTLKSGLWKIAHESRDHHH